MTRDAAEGGEIDVGVTDGIFQRVLELDADHHCRCSLLAGVFNPIVACASCFLIQIGSNIQLVVDVLAGVGSNWCCLHISYQCSHVCLFFHFAFSDEEVAPSQLIQAPMDQTV